MPILGMVASSLRSSVGGPSYEWIATATATSSSTTLNFSNIPQTYQHLRIIGMAKSTYSNSGTGESGYGIQWGSGSTPLTSGYYFSRYFGTGSGSRGSNNGTSPIIDGSMPWDNTGSFSGYVFGPVVLDIFNYSSTTTGKSFKLYKGFACNNTSGNTNVQFHTGFNGNTNAINYILFDATSTYADGPFATNTNFNLYGVK